MNNSARNVAINGNRSLFGIRRLMRTLAIFLLLGWSAAGAVIVMPPPLPLPLKTSPPLPLPTNALPITNRYIEMPVLTNSDAPPSLNFPLDRDRVDPPHGLGRYQFSESTRSHPFFIHWRYWDGQDHYGMVTNTVPPSYPPGQIVGVPWGDLNGHPETRYGTSEKAAETIYRVKHPWPGTVTKFGTNAVTK